MALPLLAHCDLDAECYGCLIEIVEEAGSFFVCNECGVVVSKEGVARLTIQMESCEATCPYCGKVNRVEGVSEVSAFRCQCCGEGVAL